MATQEQIRRSYAGMSDDQLLDLAILEARDLRPEAVEILRQELRSRGLDPVADEVQPPRPLWATIFAIVCLLTAAAATVQYALLLLSESREPLHLVEHLNALAGIGIALIYAFSLFRMSYLFFWATLAWGFLTFASNGWTLSDDQFLPLMFLFAFISWKGLDLSRSTVDEDLEPSKES